MPYMKAGRAQREARQETRRRLGWQKPTKEVFEHQVLGAVNLPGVGRNNCRDKPTPLKPRDSTS